MDFQVIISPPAIDDLKNIVSYIAPHNPAAALRMGEELIRRTRILARFPEIGRRAPEADGPDVREIIYRSYRIFYRVKPEQRVVQIIRFWHGARGFPIIPSA
ncbi:MAG TPA: type II toxin-antitoxin system RelE/ParE family toxin [Verrucomicrobiae bacterium]|nr:type II toxin-antitoxin system RelE/ParE family toxin [Verrucomicrobiae bacterium]